MQTQPVSEVYAVERVGYDERPERLFTNLADAESYAAYWNDMQRTDVYGVVIWKVFAKK